MSTIGARALNTVIQATRAATVDQVNCALLMPCLLPVSHRANNQLVLPFSQPPQQQQPSSADGISDPCQSNAGGEDTTTKTPDPAEDRAEHSKKISRLRILLEAVDPAEADDINSSRSQIQQLNKLITQTHSHSA